MESAISLEVATFTPREAEQITGVSQATRRDWRRRGRGFVTFSDRRGLKRFTSYDLAYQIVMRQVLPVMRPDAAVALAIMASRSPVKILAKRAYPRAALKISGGAVRKVDRFTAYTRFMDTEFSFQAGTDLERLSLEAIRGREDRKKSRSPVAFHLVIDHYEIADYLELRQVRPYFFEVGAA